MAQAVVAYLPLVSGFSDAALFKRELLLFFHIYPICMPTSTIKYGPFLRIHSTAHVYYYVFHILT